MTVSWQNSEDHVVLAMVGKSINIRIFAVGYEVGRM